MYLRKVLIKSKKGHGNHVTHPGSPKKVSHCEAVITAGREDIGYQAPPKMWRGAGTLALLFSEIAGHVERQLAHTKQRAQLYNRRQLQDVGELRGC